MSYIKISELPDAELPLSGSEKIPLVQDGVTVQASALSMQSLGVYPEQFGTVDGIADEEQIQAAIDYAFRNNIPYVFLRAQEYNISNTMSMGNGSTAQYSTRNNVVLRGVGTQFLRLDSSGSPLEDIGTRLKWTGAVGGTILKVLGPCYGIAVQNVGFNGNSVAAIGLQTISCSRGAFAFLTFAGCTSVSWDINVVNIAVIPGTTGEGDQSTDNIAENIQYVVPANAIGIRFDGYVGANTPGFENGGDPVRWSMRSLYSIVSRVGGTGIYCGFVDQCTITNYHVTATGTPDGLACSVKLARRATVPSGGVFPQNIIFNGDVDHGQQLVPLMLDISGGGFEGGHDLGDFTTNDQQVPLVWPANMYARARVRTQGIFPNGGWVQTQGPVAGKLFHNKLLNSQFTAQSRGTSGAGVVSPARTFDQWTLTWDGSPTVNWSKVDIAPGFTDNSGNPLYALQVEVTAGVGGTFFYLGQAIAEPGQGAGLFNGSRVTSSFGIKQTAGTAISLAGVRLEQNFGTGGSPSAIAATTATTPIAPGTALLTSSWAWPAYTSTLASTSGKTFGTDGNSRLNWLLSLPVNATFTIQFMLPQFEHGYGPSVYDMRPAWWDEQQCSRFVRRVGAGARGSWVASSNTSGFSIGVDFEVPMRGTPTVSATTASAVVSTAGDATYTDSGNSTVSGTSLSATGCQISVVPGGTWSGTPTVFRPGVLRTNYILLSAEL